MASFRSTAGSVGKDAWGGSSGATSRSSLIDTITSLYDQMATQYQPGGTYLKGIEEQLARRKKGAMASGMQSLVSSGMAGTTQAAGLGKKFEEEVGMPTMAAAETDRIGKLTEAMMGKAGFMQQLLQDTPERTMTTIMGDMGPGILERDRAASAAKKASKTATAKPASALHKVKKSFSPFGSSYGMMPDWGNSGDINAFFAKK